MSKDRVEEFQETRKRLNDIVMEYAQLETKRFFSLDSQVYRAGALSSKMKELMGLVGSMVLRCDDCITYHITRCFEEGVSSEELEEALSISLIIGGSIVIPHLRRAFETWDELMKKKVYRV
ncbi:carboxymuconolactone decarboxylase family protein [candidate division KSB1 bacterium]|nr:carboxymuconolactone decarboxylase family protein [candidate division KSB1 bacterium]